jgi:uncharacterized protein (TIGR00290 family)
MSGREGGIMYISSWSGGKDSCFACYKALQTGYKITHLLNFISKEYKRVSFHGIEARLIKTQSELAGIHLLQKETTPNNYESEFKDAVKSLAHNEIKGMIFGDIYLEEHKQWVERVCKELGLDPIEPLWERNAEELIQDFINNGFHAVVVSGQAKFIDKQWIGQPVNRDFMDYLKTKSDVDICGEKGEYHTFVVAGPLFKGKIEITETEVISRNGYWFLDIKDFRVI